LPENILTASELAAKAALDTTTYKAMEVAYAWAEDLYDQLMESVALYKNKIDQDEFCVVYVIATDPLLPTLKRRKFYCWPYLPSPRPNQGVFLYRKSSDRLSRLWVLPVAESMAELATPGFVVDKPYELMQVWSREFYKGTFWQFIRKQHDIKMLSQEEFDELNKADLIKAGLENTESRSPDAFDFSKISAGQMENSGNAFAFQDG
jgi:hypothetical protein